MHNILHFSGGYPVEPTDIHTSVRHVGPGGQFFGATHTQERYKEAFYSHVLSDWRNYESWDEAGRSDAKQKANKGWRERLAMY